MERMIEKILNRYGRQVQIRDVKQPVMAFFQPVTGKGSNMISLAATPVGIEQIKQYVYIGPVEPVLKVEDVLTVEGKQYLVRRADPIIGLKGPVYQWALCLEKGETNLWGLDMNGYPL